MMAWAGIRITDGVDRFAGGEASQAANSGKNSTKLGRFGKK